MQHAERSPGTHFLYSNVVASTFRVLPTAKLLHAHSSNMQHAERFPGTHFLYSKVVASTSRALPTARLLHARFQTCSMLPNSLVLYGIGVASTQGLTHSGHTNK